MACKYGFSTLAGDYINIMKKTFDFNLDLYLKLSLNSMDTPKIEREAVNSKSFSLITRKLVIRKQFVSNYNLNEKVVFIILI